MNDTRKEILVHASRLFTRRGYFGTSTREIARAVGIQQPSLFHHFASKKAIIETLLTYDLEWAVQIAEACVAAPGPAAERLYRYLHEDMLHLAQSPYSVQGLYADDVMEDPSFAYWRGLRSRLRAAVRTMLTEGIQNQELVNIDPVFAERVISWILLGTHRILNREPAPEGIEPDWRPSPGLVEAAATLVMRGFIADPGQIASMRAFELNRDPVR
jgi:AcrR family transcriptional regulator